jgi:hypothetical protein
MSDIKPDRSWRPAMTELRTRRRQPDVTEAQLAVAADLRKQGLPLKSIAGWVGCSVDQLSTHFARRGVEKHDGPPLGLRRSAAPHDYDIRRLWADGHGMTEIARRIGKYPQYVDRRLQSIRRAALSLHVLGSTAGAGPEPVIRHLGLHGGQRAEQDVGECFATLRHGAEQHNDDGAHEAGGNAERDDHRAPGSHGA